MGCSKTHDCAIKKMALVGPRTVMVPSGWAWRAVLSPCFFLPVEHGVRKLCACERLQTIDLMPDKSWRACVRARSRLYAFPMHFPTAFGPSQAVSFALECDLGGFFLLALFWNTPPFMQMRLFAGIRKRCHFETAIKVNAQVVCITKPSPVAVPFVCSSLPVSLFSSKGRPWKDFQFSQSWATAFWEDKHNIHLIAGENPMAFFH